MKIYFEGIPGSGKTSLVSWLNDLPDYAWNAIPEYLNPREAELASKQADQAYFFRNDEAKFRLAADTDAISLVDRGHLSTLFYCKAYETIHGKQLADADAWYEDVVLAENLLPDMYVFIDANLQTASARRPKTPGWDNVWDHPEALHFVRSQFLRYAEDIENVNVLWIDGNQCDIAGMGSLVLGSLWEKGVELTRGNYE